MSDGRARIPLRSRLFGLGGVYAKTLRDTRRSFLIATGVLAGLMLVFGGGIGVAYSTLSSRAEMANLAKEVPPIMAGLTGKALNVGTVGGYMTWKYGPWFAIIASVWSILSMSGLLAGEARRGSLDFLAATPLGRRRIALEKLSAHVTAVTVAMVIMALSCWFTGTFLGKFASDAIPPQAAIGYALWLGLVALASGSLAWVLAQFFGRSAGAGLAGVVMLGGYMLNGYVAAFPSLAGIARVTWFNWTNGHNPLGGEYDWPSLIPLALLVVVFCVIGVEAFARRDLGATSALPIPSLPGPVLGLTGPTRRAFGERLPRAMGWGLGMGMFGLVIAAVSPSLADSFSKLTPDLLDTFRRIFPNNTLTTAGGALQLVFVQLGYVIVGFAAVTLVSGWASDEASGRLEILLSTRLSRARWAITGGLGVMLAEVAMTVVIAAAIGIGAVMAGSDPLTPMAGTAMLGLYPVALTGVGVAVGGVVGTEFAAEVLAVVVALTLAADLFIPALKLPEWVHSLALTSHLGQPMIGIWDAPGIVACLAIAAAGLGIGALGMRRRDL